MWFRRVFDSFLVQEVGEQWGQVGLVLIMWLLMSLVDLQSPPDPPGVSSNSLSNSLATPTTL